MQLESNTGTAPPIRTAFDDRGGFESDVPPAAGRSALKDDVTDVAERNGGTLVELSGATACADGKTEVAVTLKSEFSPPAMLPIAVGAWSTPSLPVAVGDSSVGAIGTCGANIVLLCSSNFSWAAGCVVFSVLCGCERFPSFSFLLVVEYFAFRS